MLFYLKLYTNMIGLIEIIIIIITQLIHIPYRQLQKREITHSHNLNAQSAFMIVFDNMKTKYQENSRPFIA